ncbi:MAG: hypothetical protein ABH872_04630 [Candidatus Omnitrophota bacterium]
MIQNKVKVEKFYQSLIRKEKIPYKKALQIYEALYKEAVSLGVINSDNILEGLEIDIKIADALRALKT